MSILKTTMTQKNATQTLKLSPQLQSRLGISLQTLTEFCQAHQITELAVFGSILRDDFNPKSDLDFLVTFHPQTKLSLMDLVGIQQQLEDLTGRKIDLLEKRAIENSHNWLRRQNILETAQTIYESGHHLPA
ncbi:MAG: nucleotidyltransferase family protein [Spirulinaceae cyanobacterium]